MQSRKIAVVDVKPGMQVKYNGGWWQIVSVLHNGLTPTTYGVRAKHVRNDGFASKAAPIPLWLPLGPQGIEARPGMPGATTVLHNRKTVRVLLRPRHARDPHPYRGLDGSRWARTDTASQRLIDGLADLFESGLTT
jgi:hypothetical protein